MSQGTEFWCWEEAIVSLALCLFGPQLVFSFLSPFLLNPLLCLFCANFPLAVICFDEIDTIPYQDDAGLLFCIFPYVFKPPFRIEERRAMRDIVDEQTSRCTAVVGSSDAPKSFATGSVPNLNLDSFWWR